MAVPQAQTVLRYWLSALRLEEALAARPRARKLPAHVAGPSEPRVDAPSPGQAYFKQPLDASAAEVILGKGALTRGFDPELRGYFEDYLYRCYRTGDGEDDGGHLLCFPVVHLPRAELAGLLRMRVALSFQTAAGKSFEVPSRSQRRRGHVPAPPIAATLRAADRSPEDWPFFIDTRLLHRQLGFDGDAIDRLFDALRSCEALTAGRMLALVLRALERELGSPGDEGQGVDGGEGQVGAAPERASATDPVARTVRAVSALVSRNGGRARAFPVAIVLSGQQAKTTWHLQQEITQLLRRRQPRMRDAPVLASYLTGQRLAQGRGLQRALGRGPALTGSQVTAAEQVWGSQLSAVQGPPGTGKTTLIQHLCAEFLVRQVEPLLDGDELGAGPLVVTSSNNRAVDNALEIFWPAEPESDPMRPGLPLALRAGSRQVCERVTAPQLEHAVRFLERQVERSRGERAQALGDARQRFAASRDRANAALTGRARAFERERDRAEILQAIVTLKRDGPAQPVAPGQSRPASASLDALSRLEARLIELCDRCEITPSPHVLHGVAAHFERTRRTDLTACEDALRAAGVAPDLGLPPDLPASTDPSVLLEAWQEASEAALVSLADVVEALRGAEREERRATELSRLEARLSALGPDRDAPPADQLEEAEQRALFEAAMALREAFAAHRAERLLPVVTSAFACVREHRSLKPLLRDDPDAVQALQRLFGVWGCTLLSLGNAFSGHLESLPFVIIDEAGQCHPAHAVGGLLRARRALVIGDVHQLAPVIELTADDERRLIERLPTDLAESHLAPYRVHQDSQASVQALADRAVPTRLSLHEHFRCQADIIALCDTLCDYRLRVLTPRQDRRDRAPFLTSPIGWLATPGTQERLGGSWFNAAELAVVDQLVRRLLAAGIGAHELAVITPYRGQLERLRRMFLQQGVPLEASLELVDLDEASGGSARARGGAPSGLALGTVHRFQGGERSIVVLSSVVSRRASLPFLNERKNLLNVAISRARHHLLAVGRRDLLAEGAVTGVLANAGAVVQMG